ncbi:MAG TPA: hypothetical protein VMU10_10650, partial [Desulfomonilia bacterium]|nr:hypothetical protein [Desulfomonilia bacterium]
MKNNKNLYLYTAVFIGAIVLSGCSTMTQNVDKRDPTPGFLETSYYRGDLIPGKVQTSLLISNDIWQFQGVKGRRVVIMDL